MSQPSSGPHYAKPNPYEVKPFCFPMQANESVVKTCKEVDHNAGEGKTPGREMFLTTTRVQFDKACKELWNQRVKPWAEGVYDN